MYQSLPKLSCRAPCLARWFSRWPSRRTTFSRFYHLFVVFVHLFFHFSNSKTVRVFPSFWQGSPLALHFPGLWCLGAVGRRSFWKGVQGEAQEDRGVQVGKQMFTFWFCREFSLKAWRLRWCFQHGRQPLKATQCRMDMYVIYESVWYRIIPNFNAGNGSRNADLSRSLWLWSRSNWVLRAGMRLASQQSWRLCDRSSA